MTLEKVGRYEIIRLLGRGGMASVYLANDPNTKRQVAVKILPRELTLNTQFRARFQQEAEFIAKLEHPSIVPIYDFGEHDEQPYIVMQYMAGGSLADKLDKGSLPLGDIHPIMERLAAGMDEAHRKGIIHRDLKPGNILFDLNGLAYIADFGIAKLGEAGAGLTGSGIIGTPAYMSPEQARGKETLDGRSDVYSLGVILFEMLTGKLPFEADTPMGMAVAHINDPVPDVLSLNRSLPPACRAIIQRALAKERTARYASAGELAAALAGVRPGAVRAAPSTRTLSGLPGPRRRWLFWVVTAGGLLALLFVLVRANLGSSDPTPTPDINATPNALIAANPPSATEFRTKAPEATTRITQTPTQTRTPAPTLTLSPTSLPNPFVDARGVKMALIPAGSFQMGSENGDTDEVPVHTVFLDVFYIDQYEVTNLQFAAFLNNQGNRSEGGANWLDTIESDVHIQQNDEVWQVDGGFANHPVMEVSWFGAQAFCEWRTARLPTEAEWEKAARGGLAGKPYPWGDEFNETMANFCDINCGEDWADATFDDGYAKTAPVGSYPANGYGLYDMAGNVWEWLVDWYHSGFYGVSPENNPFGPENGDFKVLRGGSWLYYADSVRTTYRGRFIPSFTSPGIGFRCALSP